MRIIVKTNFILSIAVVTTIESGAIAFTPASDLHQSTRQLSLTAASADENDTSFTMVDRRQVFSVLPAALTGATTIAWKPHNVNAAMENSQTVFQVGRPLTMAEAEARLRDGRKSAQYLLDHYAEISEGGGDNVRRYLGTVGTTSGLFGIAKVMSALSEKADDFVEYTEVSNEVLKSIQQADGSAYMAIFVTTSTSQTPPSKYFNDAKIEIKRCIKALDDLAALIDVKIT